MKKTILLLFAILSFIIVNAQDKADKILPFVLLIDNEVPVYSDTHGVFLIKDSIGTVQDSVMFKYDVGVLSMIKTEYQKLFATKPPNQLSLKIYHLSFNADTTYVYEKRIPIEYINGEYPHGYLNNEYFIVKIFNKFDADSRAKYYFKAGENYIILITIPGMGDVIPRLKKG
jgi:hypothetical protein